MASTVSTTSGHTEASAPVAVGLWALGGLWRAAKAVAAVVRPVGWVLIAVTAVLWIVGERLGWWELVVAALVLTVAIVLCALLLIGRTAYDVDLDLGRSRVVVGERAVGALTLANHGERAILPSRVILPVGAGRGVFAVDRLAPGAAVEELFAIPTSRRGVLAVGPVSVVRGDPLGLFERVHHRDEPIDLYVHPKTVSFAGQTLGFMRDLEGLPAADLSPDDVSFHALREYQPGDDLRHVHWRSSARVGELMVRQYEETRRSHFVIGLSTAPGDVSGDDEFELAVSVTGSLGLRALRDSRRVDVHVPGRALPAATGKRFLDALAGLDHSRPRDGRLEELAGTVAAAVPLAAVAVLVCGSTVDAARLRVACSRLPYGTRVLAVQVDTRADDPELRRIGDAAVVTVSRLDQLPSALQRVLS
ncbi:DUF58 domain-containing protein [Microbacterium protaetiae]|uniref:DUF58 domain-containing protein n=1 Tax=Microbacterium protaetiae TaxID=2509458 RepID=A0A4P6ECX3_9MICO|nr:DUF58 domain-containing protein [Microbacterium protaetiae]QAY59934.1 DUF58 domain-containing protein [Microbacterium protaetiae]